MLKEELYSPDGGVMPKKEELYSPDGGVMPSQSAPPAVALGSMPNSGAKLTASVDPRPVSLCKCAMESVQIILLIILISILGTYADCEATRMKTEEQCKNDNDPFSKACMDFRHCNFGGIIIVSILSFMLLIFRIIASRFSPTLAALRNRKANKAANPADELGAVAEHVQSVIDSPVFVGIHVRCSHMETRTESYTDNDNQSRTRTKQVSVTSYSHTYDFSSAASSVDSSLFCGNDVLQVDARSAHLTFVSGITIDADPALGALLNAWKDHLYTANSHRDNTTSATITLTPAVPVRSEQMVCLSTNAAHRNDFFMTPQAYWMSVFMMWNTLYVYLVEHRVSKCALNYVKCASLLPGMQGFSPLARGGEALPMQLARNDFGNYTPAQGIHVSLGGVELDLVNLANQVAR